MLILQFPLDPMQITAFIIVATAAVSLITVLVRWLRSLAKRLAQPGINAADITTIKEEQKSFNKRIMRLEENVEILDHFIIRRAKVEMVDKKWGRLQEDRKNDNNNDNE